MDRKVFRDISYGMYIVSSKDERSAGCVINTLTQITSENPVISISLNKENYTNEVVKKTKKFVVSILSEKTNPNTIAKFGFSTSKDVDKFTEVKCEMIEDLPVVMDEVCGYLICEVKDIIDVQTHDIIIARVKDSKKVSDNEAMTYKYYHEVIKGKAPKKAPTYIEEKVEEDSIENNEEVWVCEICGYVHKGPLPEGFKCPMCGVDVSHFKKK